MTLSVYEQYLLELTNRARLDPLGEAARFGINLNDGITGGTISGAPLEALAANTLLSNAAEGHSQWMLDQDLFQHTGVGGSNAGARIQTAGYTLTGEWYWGENLAWRGTTGTLDLELSIDQHHEDLFRSAEHRVNTLSANFREVGIAQVQGMFLFNGINYDTSMTTLNFAKSGTSVFITGVAYTDGDMDGFYSIGEGRGGVTYSLSATNMSPTSVMTTAAGGYNLAAAAGGTARLTITHGANTTVVDVDRADGNVKVDLMGDTLLRTSGDITLVSGPITRVEALGATDISVTGNDAANTLTGGNGANALNGGGGNDSIYGGGGNDSLNGGTGSDSMTGGAGNDTLDGGTGNDTMEGGAGDDTYVVDSTGDLVSEEENGGTDTVRSSITYTLTPHVENLVLTGSGAISGAGNSGANSLIGNSAANTLEGADGHDQIWGRGGHDALYGGNGNDRAWGEEGDDTLFGGQGQDRLHGDNGNDRLEGSFGNDSLFGGAGQDSIWGHADNDLVRGGTGDDTIYGGGGDDTLEAQSGSDRVWGDVGVDALYGGVGFDTLYGGEGNDSLYGGDWSDSLYGGQGVDRIWGGNGNDDIFGGTEGDSLYGGLGADRLLGEDGNDRLFGGTDSDRLFGGAGNDALFGDTGNDTLNGGLGNDTLNGGAGADRFVLEANSGRDIVADFSRLDGDRVVLDRAAFDGSVNLAWVVANASSAVDGSTVITALDGSVLVLQGITDLATADLSWA